MSLGAIVRFRRTTLGAMLASAAFAGQLAVAAEAAPLNTRSVYVTFQTDTNAWDSLGCDVGLAVNNGSRPSNGAVILGFGSPTISGGVYGTNRPGTPGFLSRADAKDIAESYARGYVRCVNVRAPFLRIGIGTTNEFLNGVDPNTHGKNWALSVNTAENWAVTNGFSDTVQFYGATDSELGYGGPTDSRAWAAGFNTNAGASVFTGTSEMRLGVLRLVLPLHRRDTRTAELPPTPGGTRTTFTMWDGVTRALLRSRSNTTTLRQTPDSGRPSVCTDIFGKGRRSSSVPSGALQPNTLRVRRMDATRA